MYSDKELRQKLLSTNYFIDNEWFEKYIKLVLNNRVDNHVKFKTQSHHIIPKCYYKLNNIEVDNTKNNLVELYYKDHILAHLYIANATNNIKFKHRNMKAVDHILGNKNFKFNNMYELEKELIINSELYQKTYEQTKEFWSQSCNLHNPNSQSKEQRRLNGLQNTNRHYVNKNGIVKAVREEDFNKYLADGWIEGNSNNVTTNFIFIHKGDIQKSVPANNLNTYIANGWVKGKVKGRGIHKCAKYKILCTTTGNILSSFSEVAKYANIKSSKHIDNMLKKYSKYIFNNLEFKIIAKYLDKVWTYYE